MKNESLQYHSPEIPGIEALSCKGDFVFDRHLHNGCVLWLNSAGGEAYSIKGESAVLQPGTVSIIEPGVVHSNHALDNSRRHLRSFYLEEEFFTNLEKQFTGEERRGLLLPTAVVEERRFCRRAIALHEAILAGGGKLQVEERVISLFASLPGVFDREVERRFSAYSDARLRRITEFMREESAEEISLERLAEIAGCSSFHVIRLFRSKVGISPHALLVQFRLERARTLIESGLPLAEVALCCGFADQSHLTRNFRRRFGVTPGAYRRQKIG